jgi:pyruvate-formate lyase-activating enzyme
MFPLPWTSQTAPAAVLEINRQCNIACKGCYRKLDGTFSPLDTVLSDLRDARRCRKVQTVAIAGGETSLHPQLEDIVRAIHQQGMKVSLFTNGLIVDDAFLDRLKQAGLDLILFHIDEGQRRPDLSRDASADEINALRARYAERAAEHGLDAGLAVTIYRESAGRVSGLIDFILNSKHIHYLFATNYYDPRELMELTKDPSRHESYGRIDNREIRAMLARDLGMEPFAYRPCPWQSGDGEILMSWMTYFVPVIRDGKTPRRLLLKSGRADRTLLRLSRLLSGRYIFYCRTSPFIIGAQIVANMLGTGSFREPVSFLRGLREEGARLVCKRLIFDNGPTVTSDGKIACCDFCPVASPREGKLHRVCMGDIADVPWYQTSTADR